MLHENGTIISVNEKLVPFGANILNYILRQFEIWFF